MSIPSYTDEPDGPPPGAGMSARLVKAAAAAAAAAALVFGAKAIAGGGAATSTADAAGGRPVQPVNGYGPPGMPGGGDRRFGAGRGFGAEVTGATLTRLKDAVASKYPGTVEHAMKLPDGSYVVHVIRSDGSEVHVHVSKAFKVLGAAQGGPGRPGGDGHAGGPPPGVGFGADVTGATLSKLEAAISAKWPGTVERAMQLPDGSYVVHVIRSGGAEVHVHVSKAFKVLGALEGGPGRVPGSAGGTPGTVS